MCSGQRLLYSGIISGLLQVDRSNSPKQKQTMEVLLLRVFLSGHHFEVQGLAEGKVSMMGEERPKGPDKPVVLYVEDDKVAAHLFEIAVKEVDCAPVLFVVMDGDSAINFFSRSKPYSDAPKPDLVVLDINLPGLDGLSVLQYIRQRASVRELPVVMFTSSTLRVDKEKAEQLGASGFFHKPMRLEEFWEAVRKICSFITPMTESSATS